MPDALLKLHVTPRASRSEITGWRGDALCVKITAPPVEGAANEAIPKLLADALGLRKSQIELVSGGKSREKTVKVTGVSESDLRARLASRATQVSRR
jgi:uncharacterized protein